MGNEPSVLMINPRPNSTLSILDEKSFLEICKYLKMFDLLQLAEVDINYQRIIGEHIIANQTLDITEISPNYEVRDVFKCFGEFAQELAIRETDIQYKNERYTFAEEIFRLIKKRCAADRLKAITIYFDSKDWLKKPYKAAKFLDVFAQVESITIGKSTLAQSSHTQRDKCLDEFLQKVLIHCTKLKSLKLINLSCAFEFLRLPQLRYLHSLEFEHCDIASDGWAKFLADAGIRPHLKSLTFNRTGFYTKCHYCIGKVEQNQFLSSIATAFPNLESFCLIYPRLRFIEPNCSALQTLAKLKELRVTAEEYPNLIETLAVNATIEKLTLSLAGLSGVGSVDKLLNLRSIELLDLRQENLNICEAFSLLPQLNEIILRSTFYFHDEHLHRLIRQLVTNSSQLRVLKVFTAYALLNVTLYKRLINIRRNQLPNGPPLQLYASFSTVPKRAYAPEVVTICKKPKNNSL